MRLGLGLSVSSELFLPSFSPLSLTPTGWWRADFPAGTTWSDVSGNNRTLTELTGNPPTQGTAVNGRIPADFNGTSQRLNTTGALTTLLATAAGGVAILFRADTAAAPGANPGNDAALVTTNNARRFAVAYNSSGVRVDIYNGDGVSWTTTPHTTAATGAWHWAFVGWDATKIYVQINRGSIQETTITGTSTFDNFTMRVGGNFLTNRFFDGRILEFLTLPARVSAAQATSLITYGNERYALSL